MGSLPMTRRGELLKLVFWLSASHEQNYSTVFLSYVHQTSSLKLLMGVPNGAGWSNKIGMFWVKGISLL